MKKLLLGLSLALTVTACGGSTPNGPVKGGNNTGGEQAPQVSIYTLEKHKLSNTYLQPGTKLMLTASDDGRVEKLVYTLQPAGGQPQLFEVQNVSGRNVIALPNDLVEGQYLLTATATDDAGLTSKDSASFRVDLTPPVFTGITLNESVVGDSSINVMGSGVLKVAATDKSGPVDLRVLHGDEVIASGTNALSIDLTIDSDGNRRKPGTYTFTVEAMDISGRVTRQQVSITVSQPRDDEGPTEQAPAPVLQVVGEGPFAGDVSVNVAANLDAYSELQKMVLIVTDDEGFSDSTTYTTTQARQQFSVDTTRFSNGELTLKVEVFTESGLKGASSGETITINNVNAPEITIVTPDNNSSTSSPELPVKVTITKVTSDYKFVDPDLTVELRDYRGSLKAKRVLNIVDDCMGDTGGTITCNTSFDLGDGDAGYFTVTALAEVDVVSLGERVISDKARFTSTVANASAPASNIVMPVRLSGDGADLTVEPVDNAEIPVLNRASSVVVNASDDDGLKYMQVRFLYSDGTPVNAYLLNRNLDGVTDTYNVVSPIELDGSEYIANGNYILQMTTEDILGNTNIQEIWVRVDRGARIDANLVSAAEFTDKRSYASGQLTHSGGMWGLGPTCNGEADPNTEQGYVECTPLPFNSRIISLLYFRAVDGSTGISERNIRPYHSQGNTVHDIFGFTNEGSYWVKWIVQDMDTGVVETYTGTELAVQKNE